MIICLKQTFLDKLKFGGTNNFRDTALECTHGYGAGIK